MLARPLSLLGSINSNDLSNAKQTTNILHSSRSLYTDVALGISKLDKLRESKSQLFAGPTKDRYIERLSDYLKANDAESIYKDDLVNLIGIAADEKDLDLIEQVVIKSCARTTPFMQGWGALVMRLYYKMKQLDRAYENVKDVEKFGNFFNLRSCYKVMMTMLYDAGRYDAVLEIFHLSQERLKPSENRDLGEDEMGGPERDLCTIAFAALARMNNQEALEQAEALYNKLNTNSRGLGLRPASFFAYIACSNDKPKLALNLISNTPNRNYISLRELKIASLIKLGRYEDILLQLREYVSNIKRESNLLLKSTYGIIQKNLDKIEDPAIRQELNDLMIEIKENGHVAETTIEELLFKPIDQDRLPFRVNKNFGFNQGAYMGQDRSSNFYRDQSQGEQRGDNRYQSRPPRNQYGNRQNNNQYDHNNNFGGQRSPRRFSDHRNDEGDDRSSRRRFTHQNMNFE